MAPGSQAVTDALFLPASARQAFEAVFLGSTLRIKVKVPEPERRPRLVAVDVADRQRRRKTWEQNVDRYALPDDTKIYAEVSGSAVLRGMLGESPRSRLVEPEAGEG